MGDSYVHGYDPQESQRLQDQAGSLADVLHSDTFYPPGSPVLEARCGVGAQTGFLAQSSPEARMGLVRPEDFDAGIQAVHRTAEDDGVFCYTFFKGWGRNRSPGERELGPRRARRRRHEPPRRGLALRLRSGPVPRYDRHDAERVYLYFEESFSFRVVTPEVSVTMPPPAA